MPRSRLLTDPVDRPAASASSSWVSLASARSCRSSPANESPGFSATALALPHSLSAPANRHPAEPILRPTLRRPRPPAPSRRVRIPVGGFTGSPMGGSVWCPRAPLATVEPAPRGPPPKQAPLPISVHWATQAGPNLDEVVMNHIRRSCRSLSGLPRKGGLLIASAAPAVLWADRPLPRGWNKYLPLPAVLRPALRLPPGWNKHPPPASHVHTPATGSMPGWQLALMAATVMLLVVTSVAIGYPGPDRTPPGARTHRRSDDR